MSEPTRKLPRLPELLENTEQLLSYEWLVTNGIGGYASSTIAGINTRRYHGLLIAALPAPIGRMVVLNELIESLVLSDNSVFRLTGEERSYCALQMHGFCFLTGFMLEEGLPVWYYRIKDITLEKRLIMRYQQNTVQIIYKLISGDNPVTLVLSPAVHFRAHHEPVDAPLANNYSLTLTQGYYEIAIMSQVPALRIIIQGSEVNFVANIQKIERSIYRMEAKQGYPSLGDLWNPGSFQIKLNPGQEIAFIASTHDLPTILAIPAEQAIKAEKIRRQLLLGSAHPEARQGVAAELVLAADQFIITPAGRLEDAARIRASGGDVRTVIAGYHWFTDWGRDTMISLEGLTLLTGRQLEARWILYTFSHYIRDGLIPNMFPEGQREGIYNTADATLWFFHALDRYLEYTRDRTTLRLLLPDLKTIIEYHFKGTVYGIFMDIRDRLLSQGQPGYALTWMDAKVGDWVVTPRRGKAVEINALWYNALRLLERWISEEEGEEKSRYLAEQARLVRKSFNERFWYAEGGYLYDVIDGENGNDPSCRPNQLLAISLRFPVLDRSRWETVFKVVTERLLTPFGLRSLSSDSPFYQPEYFGDIRARDAAYHQGTIWAWLIGPYIDAWLKINPSEKRKARRLLELFLEKHLNEACIGSISEIFDAEFPFTPRGCVAQAWSVAEALRSWIKTV